MFDLKDHVALITGGNGGIGLAFAKGLVKAGARVAICARNGEKNATALEELTTIGGEAVAFECDVTDRDQVHNAVSATVARFGHLDSCFANAGGAGISGYLHKTDSADWNSVIDLNINGVVNSFGPVTEYLLENRRPGKLIATSSVAALMGTPFQASYATTKAAVVGLVRSLAVELGQNGISVNAVLPGYVESDLTAATPQAFKDAAQRRACLGRVGRLEDMEGVAVFLASRHSDYMTGHDLVMDGGHTIHPM